MTFSSLEHTHTSGLRIPHWKPLDGIASQTRKDVGSNVAGENMEPPKCPLLEAGQMDCPCNLYQDVFVSDGNYDKRGFRVAQLFFIRLFSLHPQHDCRASRKQESSESKHQ